MEDSPLAAQGSERPGKMSPSPKMLFADLYKVSKGPLSRLRHSQPQPLPVDVPSDVSADLVSKDKAKQKEAVKRYLAEKVRNDWHFSWPPASATTSASDLSHETTPSPRTPATQPPAPSSVPATAADDARRNPSRVLPKSKGADPPFEQALASPRPGDTGTGHSAEGTVVDSAKDDSDAVSVYSTVSENTQNFKPMIEWSSELSDDDGPKVKDASPFRFDSPDAVGTTILAEAQLKRASRRRETRKEAEWNPGLACFLARRDAWTGAKTVKLKPKPAIPLSPTPSRRLFWKTHRHSKSTASATHDGPDGSPISPTSSYTLALQDSRQTAGSPPLDHELKLHHTNGSSTHSSANCQVETVVPLPPPILPAANPMRASIGPALYLSLYDKIVVHNLQPSCPVNLVDMVRACVAGWKRDGEWPPRPAEPIQADVVAVRRKKSQQKDHGRRMSTASASGVRRLSFGFLGRGADKDEKDREKEREKERERDQEREKPKEQDEHQPSAGKVKRGLQRVLGLGREPSQLQPEHHDAKGKILDASVVMGAPETYGHEKHEPTAAAPATAAAT